MVAKGVLRYLQWTINVEIKYTDSFDVKLTGYLDSDWARDMDDRRSITGYAFNIGSGVISWSSKKQNAISLSSIGAEYQVVCATTCEVIWLRRILHDAWEEQKDDMVIKCDNQSSIKLENNPVFHKNTKHIDTWFHFVTEKVQSKQFFIEYCNTYEYAIDIFTKPLGKLKFELFREMLGVKVNSFSIKGENWN